MYRGRCTGRLNDVMKLYLQNGLADKIIYGDGNVYLFERQIATYTWDTSFGMADMPIFKFACLPEAHLDLQHLNASQSDRQKHFEEQIKDDPLSIHDVEYTDDRVLRALHEKAFQSMSFERDLQRILHGTQIQHQCFTGKIFKEQSIKQIGFFCQIFDLNFASKINRTYQLRDIMDGGSKKWLLVRIDK